MSDDILLTAARNLGNFKGSAKAEMVCKCFVVSTGMAKVVIDGYANNDSMVTDLYRSPFDSDTDGADLAVDAIDDIAKLAESDKLLANANIEAALDESADILDAYEAAYKEAFWQNVLFYAQHMMEAS